MTEITRSIAIVGAGMAGLSCATELARQGIQTCLFDKGRGPGGRMATRRAEVNGETLRFDHGAQYFTARDPDFIETVSRWESDGVVARWPEAGAEFWVGTPAMNAPLRAMAEALDVTWGARIESLDRIEGGWRIRICGETRDFARVILAIPAEQAAELLTRTNPQWAALASASHSDPCWAVMASFAEPLPLADTVRDENAPISWAARNGAKPGREGRETWVLHASPARSREILEHGPDAAAELLLRDFFDQTAIDARRPHHLAAHRWRFAMAQTSAGEPSRHDPASGLGLCGDWLASPRVEGAFLSGLHLARAISAAS